MQNKKIFKSMVAIMVMAMLSFGFTACVTEPNNNGEENNTSTEQHEHKWVVNSQTDADCMYGSKTIYTCECGSEKTEIGEALGHSFSDGVCARCGETQSIGLSYRKSNDGTYYILEGMGECTDEDVVIPDTYEGLPIKEIESYAFEGNESIKTLSTSENIEKIGDRAFANCTNLESGVSTETVKRIEDYAFYGCTSLKEFTMHEGLEYIGEKAFGYTQLSTLILPDSVTEFGWDPFIYCEKLEKVVLGDGMTEVVSYMFDDCPLLTDITWGENIEVIKDHAFQNTSIEVLDLPDSVTRIADCAFYECESLKEIVLHEGLEYIGARAFGYAPISTLTIPDSVTEFGWDPFIYCGKLEKVVLGDGMTEVVSYMFDDCPLLTDITWGENIEVIKDHAFQNTSIEVLDLPDSVTRIEDCAFYECDKLYDVTLRNNLEEIGERAFDKCDLLERIFYKGTPSDWESIEIGYTESVLGTTPYFYSETRPNIEGDYWYYTNKEISNSDYIEETGKTNGLACGKKRIWNLTTSEFQAERYAELFPNIIDLEQGSFAAVLLDQMENHNPSFMRGVTVWNGLHVIEDPSFAIDIEKGLLSNKDLYKFTLINLLSRENIKSVDIFAAFKNDITDFLMDGVGVLGEKSLEALKKLDVSVYEKAMKNAGYIKLLDKVGSLIGHVQNAYEAHMACARYEALSKMESGFLAVLLDISTDTSNPWDLRLAAEECIIYFKLSFELTKEQLFAMEMFDEEVDSLWDGLIKGAWQKMAPAWALTAMGLRALGNEYFKMDAIIQAYYQVKVSVGIEKAARRIFENPEKTDYVKQENYEEAEKNMYAIELYKRAVFAGFDFCEEWIAIYKELPNMSEEEKTLHDNMIAQMPAFKAEKQTNFDQLEKIVQREYDIYYQQ